MAITASLNKRWYPDGRVEAIDTVRAEAGPRYNPDLAPRSDYAWFVGCLPSGAICSTLGVAGTRTGAELAADDATR